MNWSLGLNDFYRASLRNAFRPTRDLTRDGYSTSGTQGTGLGAIRRLAHTFDIFSAPDRGTVLVAQVIAHKSEQARNVTVGTICVPIDKEQECGDSWGCKWAGNRFSVCIADGLGHGILAAEASQLALKIFDNRADSLSDALTRMHSALKATRGAAVSLAELDLERMVSRFVGLGNVAGFLCESNASRSLVSQHGTVGHHFHPIQEFSNPINKGTDFALRWNQHALENFKISRPAFSPSFAYCRHPVSRLPTHQ